jgi:hypothetical protein
MAIASVLAVGTVAYGLISTLIFFNQRSGVLTAYKNYLCRNLSTGLVCKAGAGCVIVDGRTLNMPRRSNPQI